MTLLLHTHILTHTSHAPPGLAQRDISMLQQQLTAASETTSEHQRQNESIRLRNAELIEELKTVARREQEVCSVVI